MVSLQLVFFYRAAECEAARQMEKRRSFFCDAFCKLQLILRRLR